MSEQAVVRPELTDDEMEIMTILCPRCSSSNTKPYGSLKAGEGRQYCLQCGMTWRRNGEPDVQP